MYTRSPTSSPEAIFHTGDCVGAAVCRAGWRSSLPAGAVLWSPVARGLSRRPCTAQSALPDLGRSTECVSVALISMLRCGSGVAVSRGPPFAACVPAPGLGGGGGGRVETRGEGTAGEAGGHAGEKGCRVGCRSFSLDAAGLKLPGRLRRRSLGCLWQPLHVPSCGAFRSRCTSRSCLFDPLFDAVDAACLWWGVRLGPDPSGRSCRLLTGAPCWRHGQHPYAKDARAPRTMRVRRSLGA